MKKVFAVLGALLFMSALLSLSPGRALAAGDMGCNCRMGQMQGGGMPDYDMMGGGGYRTRGMKGPMMMHGGMHGEVEQGMMMGGLSDMEMAPMLKERFMKAMMKSMIRNALQDPEIKGFLDSTAQLRRDLVMKQFDYFEAFRNPATTPGELKKLKAGIMDLKMKIRQKMMSQKNPAMQ